MAQKPVDQRSQYATREYLWQVMLKLGSFTAPELTRQTRYHLSTVKSYLKGLVAAKIIALDGITYTIDPETAPLDPPRVREDGSTVTQGMGRTNMWRTLKMRKQVTVAELAGYASSQTVTVALSEAEYYLIYLEKAGYVELIENSSPRRYRFNHERYTGPKAPMIQKVLNVFDQNTRQIVWQSGEVSEPRPGGKP
jgi:hypothetical protein